MLETEGIYIDDTRTPIETPPFITGWVVVKSYQEFRDTLFDYVREFKKCPEIISFDHDLAQEHYTHHATSPIGTPPDYTNYKEKTGLHCAKLLTELCHVNNIDPPKYISVHSHNPIGASNIQHWINYWKKTKGLEADCFVMRYKFTVERAVELKDGSSEVIKPEEEHEPQG